MTDSNPAQNAAQGTASALPRLSGVTWRGCTLTGEEFALQTGRIAGGLHRLGLGPGSTVALVLRNSVDLLAADRAVRWLGANSVPVNWHASPDDINYVIRDSRAQLALLHPGFVPPGETPAAREVIVPYGDGEPPAGPVRAGSVDWADLLSHGLRGPRAGGAVGDSTIYTSGTTGRPKGVRRKAATGPQRAYVARMRSGLYRIRSGARLLVTSPLYHSAPLQFATLAGDLGELVVIGERFDPEAFLEQVETYQITHTFAVPTMFSRILALPESVRRRYDVSSLEFVLHAGAPCPPALKRRMIDEWGPILFEYYASTELGPVTFCTSQEWIERPGTVGRPIEGVELDFIDAETGKLGARPPAEIAVRNDGYPDFTYLNAGDARAALQHGGHVATGDVGYTDDGGYLFISDRVRDMIISGGVNLYPAEIEAVIQELPNVADCAVFAVADDDLGEAVAAVVQPAAAGAVTVADIRAHVASRLGRLKHPRVIELRDSLPRQENGKIKKGLLRSEFERQQQAT